MNGDCKLQTRNVDKENGNDTSLQERRSVYITKSVEIATFSAPGI